MYELATFALGCFWQPDESFSELPGVQKVAVGYSGGSIENPTYQNLGDHTETVQIEFDPKLISYEDLLEHFWQQHDSTEEYKTQYKSIIFFHTTEQRRLAEASKKVQQALRQAQSKQIVTQIRPASAFYLAEEYHQKYLQKLKRQN